MLSKGCLLPIVIAVILPCLLHAQDSTDKDKLFSIPGKLFTVLDRKAGLIEQRLNKKTEHYLIKLQRQEHRLQKKLEKKDSLLSRQIFSGIDSNYARLRLLTGEVNKYSAVYSGRLDSLSTALKFLTLDGLKSDEAKKMLGQLQSLQSQLNAAEQIRKFIYSRQIELKQKLGKVGMLRELKNFQKQAYYYRAQLNQIQQDIKDPDKWAQKLITLARKQPGFKEFFAHNSVLGSLFAIPGGGSDNGSTVSIQGLQTRAMLSQSLTSRFGTGQDVTCLLQNNVQAAKAQLSTLKAKLAQYSSGGYSNGKMDNMPDFRPNEQKTKTFFQRLEYGFNIQSQRARYYFPVTSDLALSLGYRLTNNGVLGVGFSYKMGLANGWDHIALSHQGVGLRSYLDWKLKGSLYISGGYEKNYLKPFTNMSQLKGSSYLQNSGLIGLSKRYKAGKKLNGEIKILWDFLSYQQVPKRQAIIFRIGYSFK
jgi:hypothetical protein